MARVVGLVAIILVAFVGPVLSRSLHHEEIIQRLWKRSKDNIESNNDSEGSPWYHHPLIQDTYDNLWEYLDQAKEARFWLYVVNTYGDRITTEINKLIAGGMSGINDAAKAAQSTAYNYAREMYHSTVYESKCLERTLCYLNPVRERLLDSWAIQRVIFWAAVQFNMLPDPMERLMQAAYAVADAQVTSHALCEEKFACDTFIWPYFVQLFEVQE